MVAMAIDVTEATAISAVGNGAALGVGSGEGVGDGEGDGDGVKESGVPYPVGVYFSFATDGG